MFTSYLKITLRNLYRERMYAFINISGLSIAIACCIILGLYLKSELTYDRHNIKHRQIYRVESEIGNPTRSDKGPATSIVLGPMLAEEYPEIKEFVRFQGGYGNDVLLKSKDKAFYWNSTFFADDNVFDVFTHDIIYGDPKTALVDSTSVAVSKSFAEKYFGNENPIGETISDDSDTYKITLVFSDLPENSHLKYDVLFSFNKIESDLPDSAALRNQMLFGWNTYTYLLMPEGYNKKDFADISESFFNKHMAERAKAGNLTWRAWLDPLADTHFQSDLIFDLPAGNKFYLYGFLAVAIFILLVACINYMNLATARAAKRAKEIGMRKILGSGKATLILQFLGESIVFSLIALFFGIVLVELALKLTPISELLGKTLTFNPRSEPGILGWMIVFGLALGFMSGIYPALYLSSMSPLSALVKGNRPGRGGIRLRELLVLIQFIISASIISCTLLMLLQMQYVSNKPLGFDKENKVIITLKGADLIEKLPTIKQELMKNRNILNVSTGSNIIGQSIGINGGKADNNEGVFVDVLVKLVSVGEGYIDLMGMEIVAGRNFSKKLLTDVGLSFIVNEAMVKKMGWREPLGKRLRLGAFNGRVIGVVKDFHFASLHSPIEPIAMYKIEPGSYTASEEERKNITLLLFLNISGKEISSTLSFIQEKFEEFDPAHPLNYKFLDEILAKLYITEQRLMKLIGIFTGVCILISCMGLFGLAAFTTEQRTKEIGIRKVLGASTWQIIVMLAQRILLLVLAGAIIASLLAYFAMDEWMSGFAYRTGINPYVFLLSTAVAACVAFITVALQSFKTAQSNPVKALRYE